MGVVVNLLKKSLLVMSEEKKKKKSNQKSVFFLVGVNLILLEDSLNREYSESVLRIKINFYRKSINQKNYT